MKMITDLQDDVVTPNVMQLGDGPLTDIEVEPGSVLSDRWAKQSDAITMQAQSAERKMQQLVDVAYAKAGDKAAAKRVESDALLRWALTSADAENTEGSLGWQLARRYGTDNPGAVWDAMNASADYEYEQMPVWNTWAEGMRLVWGRFQKMVQGKKAAADAAQAAVNERLKGLKAFVDGKDAKRDAGGKLADDAITDGRLWEMVNKGVLELADVQRAQKVREFMRRYVRPLGKRAEMDERMRGLDGLRDEVYELIGEDKDTARVFYESLMRWAGEQRGKNDTGAGDEFQVAVGKKLSDWARAVDEVAPLALLSVGAPGPVAPALVEQAVGTYEARRDKNERQRLSSGILRAGIDEAMKVQEGGWWQSVKNAPRVAAAMAGDTLPYLVPVVGAGLGTADAFVRGFTSGIDAKVLDAELGGNQGGWESRKAMGNAAMVESGIQALVELMPWSRVGGKGLAASVGRKMKAVTGGKYVPGALSRALARGTQKSVTRALVAEFGANVVTEGVLEPIAQGALTLTAEGVMDLAGVEHGRSKSFSEAFAELGEIWEPEQLAGFLMFSAALTAPAYGQARKNVQLYQANVKKFAKNAEVWETQGLSRAEAEEAAGAENPQERGNQLVAEGWKNDAAGMHARLVQKHKELKDSGRTLVFAGVQGKSGFDADTVKLLGEAWRASKDKYHLPDVELLGDGRVRLTRAEIPGVVEGIDLTLTEEQADAFLFQELNRLDVERMRDWQKSGGNVEEYEGLQTKLAGLVDVAMGDVAVDAAVAEGSMDVEEMGKGLPEELRGLIKEAGGMNLGVAKKISEWAIGQMEALEAGGMSRAEAREQVASADGGATLGVLAGMGASMQKRLEAAGDMRLRSALNRRRGGRRVAFNGRSVLGSVLVHARGGATGMNAVEDISESVFDMMVQGRTEAILENQAAARKAAGEAERPATLTEVRAAEEQAWKELAEVARKAREALLKVDPDLAIEEVNGDRLNTIEALSTMAMSRYLGSGVLPRWMSGLVDVMRKNVQAAAAVVQLQKAMVALGEQDAGALKDLLEFLDDAGVQVGKSLAGARVEAVADRIRELARWNAGADAAGPGGVGGMSVSQAQEEVLEEEDEIQQNDKAREAVAAAKPADAAKREDAEDKRMFEPEAGRGAVPERMRGVFVGDAAVYNAAGDFWCGQVEKNKLSDGTEQVKVGEKGKHGVIAGKELTGRFVNDTAPILVWKRRDGSLQVISGRHRFAKLMEDESATGVMCYVYEESEERDERWARMKDYEQNMRDDQADEVTCAVYARETGLTEAEMRERGLTRNRSRSKRGIFIGQHAREELWTRFRNGEIKPMDAELVCKLTAALADQSQVAEIQAHCCGLLKAGKSWDYIGASVQLMASSQAQQAEQMLLDLGADFTADLARMARWVELCRKAFREAIDLLKDEKRRVKKGAKASRLGLSATMTEEKREEMLGDFEAMDAKFEMIGSYPELVAEAKMWDGDESKFADPVAMYLERVEAMQDEGLQEEQARREAEEATGMFSWSSSLTPAGARSMWRKRLDGKEVQRVVDFKGVSVDLAVSSHLGEKGGDALRRVVAGDYRADMERWKQQALAVLQGMVGKKKWNDVEQHVRAGKATMDVVKRAIAEGKIAPLPKQGGSDVELRTLHHKRIVYFEKRKGEVLELLEGVMSVRSVDESKLSSSVYFHTPYGKVRLSDHAEPMGTGHAVSTVLDLRYDMSDAEVMAAVESYMAETGGRGARIADAFHQVEAQAAVVVDVPGVYVESVSEAKNAIKGAYDELKKNPVQMGDGSVVRFYAPGLNEVKQHAGDRRVFAAIAKMRELSEKAVYIDTALNTQKDIPSKKTIERYHYYLSKGNFPGYDKWAALRGKNAGASGDAYVMIVVAEEENGDKFYDLDATDVEDVEANKGASATLEATRFPKAGRQGHDAPKGRIHRVKEYVNHIDAQNGNFSASLTGGKNLAAVTPEMEDIKAAAEKNGTFMKAPNGKPSKLTERQWLQVRTGAFKGWFGDWERAADLSFDGSEYNNETCLKMLAEEAGTPFVNDETGIEAEINNRQRGKITSGKAQRKSGESGFSTGVHNFVAAHIRRLFKHAVHVGDYRDKNQSDDVLAIKRFVCPVRIKGVEAFAYMTVKELKQHGHKIYTLELDTIERLGGNLDEHFEEMLNPAPSKGILARVNELRKTYFENVSKVVDENGEPKVYYHHTNADFTEFLHSKKGKTDAGWLGAGFYFYGIEDEGKGYGKNVMECFLNVREPYYASDDDMFRLSEADSIEESEAFTESLIEDGYDGVYYDGDLRQEMMVFEPNQIKSATDNRGTFDGNNPDITYSVTGGKNLAAVRENGIKPLWHDGTEDGRRAALAGLVDNPAVSFSVIGRNAKTWGKYTDRAFVGRDDGMWRAEIDASQAKLKWEDLRGKNVSAYRKLVAGWDNLPEAERKQVESYAEQVYDWQEESEKLNSTPESEFLEQYNKVIKLRDALKPKREEMRSLLNKMFVKHGGSAAAVLNMEDAELDELACSLWGPYVEDKVEKMLDLRPLWNGGMKLADVMEYPELYEAYPELADITVRYATMENANGRALYQDGEHEILINRNLEGEWRGIHSILLHEIQHHIQNIEGFAKGGNPSYARRLVDNRAARGDADAMSLRELSDMELYHRIAGEIEARNVEERLYWNAGDRAATPFNSTLEYPGEALVTFSVQRKRDLTLDGERVTQKQAWEHLAALEGKPLRNARSQFVAVVNKPQRKELTNIGKAWKSSNNGFSVGAHYAAVGRIEKLFLHAVPCGVYPDSKNGKSDVKILRFACPIMLGGEKAVAWMTAKKSEDKKGSERLYNLELVDIEKLAGKLESVQQSAARFTTDKVTPPPASQKLAGNLEYLASHRLNTALPAASADIVAEVEDAFKTYFEDVPEVGNNFSASLTGAAAAGRRVLEDNPAVSFSLAGVTTDWKNTLHGYLNNPPVPGSPEHARDMVVCPTPAVMQMVGAKGWDMVVTPGVLDKVMKGKHAVSVVALEQLPAAMADPICIAVSDTPGCLEVVTELKEGQHNVLVAVQLNSEHSSLYQVKVNRIASMYGKENIGALLNHPMLYWNKAKARPWINNHRLRLPAPIQPKRASGRKILKPADLVKYKLSTGLSFSLRGRGMIDSVDLGVMAREEQMQRLVSYARREAARWERTFAKDTPNAKAAEAMGTISSIQGAIMRVLPPAYRPALSAQMRYVEVYARMLESGRVRAYGKLKPEERAALQEELGELIDEDLALVSGGIWYDEKTDEELPWYEELKRKADAEKEARRVLTREFGAEKLAQAAARMLNDAADAVERRMIDVELERVERMKERLAPRKLPNGKYDKGKMSAKAYKEFVRFCGLMELEADAVAEKLHELEALIAAEEGKDEPDAARVDELAAKMAELVAYGNLKGKSQEAVRKGVAALTAFVQNERNVWQGKLERERERAKRSARVMAEQMGPGDEVKLAENAEKAEETLRMFGSMGAGFKSLAQMFYGMGGISGLRSLMDESLEALAHGHVQLGLRERRAYDRLGEFLEKQLGLDTEAKRNDWMAGLKKKIDTEVKRAGELVVHKLELTQEEAKGWLELDKAEREEKRRKMLDEAEKAGVDAQNVVYEEDLPLLRDELAKFDDLPGKRKYVRTERSWRKAQPGNIVASRDEILNILLLCEQAEYQQAADENGYTAEVLEKLRAAVGEDVMAFGHEMRRVLEGGGLAAVYEAREGIPFPAVQNYWPGKFDLSAKMNEQANALDPTTGTGTRYGMLITRVKHKLKFNLSLGASNVFLAALAQQNNYICMGELTARWRRLLCHSNFAMALKQRLGEKQFKQLKEFINLLDGAGIAESVTQQNLSSLVGRFQSAHAMAVLAGSPITLLKQTSAMLHAGAWEGISAGRVLWHLLKDRARKGAISYGEIVQMDCFKVRHRDNRYFTEMMQLGRNANWSKLATWARTGMGWIEKMDILCNAASMTALYNIKYEQLQEANAEAADPLSEEEMRGVCAKAVEQALELVAQPLRRTQKSAMAALSRNALVKSACYMSSESLNKIGMYAAIKQRNGGGIKGRVAALKFLLPMSIAQQATVMALDMLRGTAPDTDDDDWAEWFWLNVATGCTGLGMLQSVPVLGELVGWATGGYVKTASLGEMLFDFRGAVRSGKRLWKMGTDGRDYSGWEWAWQLMNAGRIVTAGTAAGRGINSTSKVFSEVSGGLQSLNAVVNHVRPVIQRVRNREEE